MTGLFVERLGAQVPDEGAAGALDDTYGVVLGSVLRVIAGPNLEGWVRQRLVGSREPHVECRLAGAQAHEGQSREKQGEATHCGAP